MHRQSETRAGNHQRHTRTRNVSLPTQANHTVRGARKQPPNWALHMQLAKIPHAHQTTPPATRAASAGQHGTHRGRNYLLPSSFTSLESNICDWALVSLQSTGAQRIGSQEQVQHQNAKSTQYRDQQIAYCTQREQQYDQPLYVSPHRGP